MDERPRGYRFEGFELDLATRELARDGRRVRLAEKPFRVLEALLAEPGRLVTRESLCRRLWPDGTHVDFANNLNTAIATLREHLGESARRPRLVETLPRLGYRFAGAVQPILAARRRKLPIGYLLVAGVLATLLALPVAQGWLQPPGATSAGETTPVDPAARRAYLRGVVLLERYDRAALPAALASLTEATRIEPRFAPARAARAEALLRTAFGAGERMRAELGRAGVAAREALQLDPRSPSAHRVLAAVAMHHDWDVTTADTHLRTALSGDPSDGRTWLAAASLSAATGNHDAAVEQATRAVTLDPASHLVRSDLGYFLLAAGRAEEARQASLLALELEPDFVPALRFLLLAEERLGLAENAVRTARRILETTGASAEELATLTDDDPSRALIAYRRWALRRAAGGSALGRALAHAALGERDPALDWLERAFDAHEPFLIYLEGFTQLRDLRGDPRFEALRSRLRVAGPVAAS